MNKELLQALYLDDVNALRLLASGPIDAKVNYDGSTLLMLAAKYGAQSACEWLLKAGARTNTQDHLGWTALMWGALGGKPAVCDMLLQAKSDIHACTQSGRSVLSFAAWDDRVPVVDVLLKAGAPIDVADDDGHTPLMIASKRGCPAVGAALIMAGASKILHNKAGKTAMDLARCENTRHALLHATYRHNAHGAATAAAPAIQEHIKDEGRSLLALSLEKTRASRRVITESHAAHLPAHQGSALRTGARHR